MTNFSNWDFLESFRGDQAAALILGIEPISQAEMMPKARPVYERMQSEYVVAWSYYLSKIRNTDVLGVQKDLPDTALVCDAIKVYLHEIDSGGLPSGQMRATFASWLSNVALRSDFNLQKFSRIELLRWLNAIGMESVYQFDRSQTAFTRTQSGHWPWGSHHTELLGQLEAAALRFWVNYEPTDKTTAPTNKDVAEWLMKERKVSEKMAFSIASMLRPDGLATGPRK